jgi:pantoate--beta-alanine ligase
MIVVEDPAEMRAFLDRARDSGKTVGLFPTTGVSHGGHSFNIAKMAAECDVAAVSIIPAPLGPGLSEEAATSARDLSADLQRAEEAGATAVFALPPEGLFSETPAAALQVARPSWTLEGSRRLQADAMIAAKLVSLAGPCYAYFGEKDYELVLLVRRVVSHLCLPAAVVACPTVREPDGLALSARNACLSSTEREAAPALYWALLAGKRAVDEGGEVDAATVRATMREVACRSGMVELDYAEVTDPATLEPAEEISGEVRLLIAGRIGRTRLVDNLAARAEEA